MGANTNLERMRELIEPLTEADIAYYKNDAPIGDADNFIAHAQGMVQRMRSTPALRMSALGTLASQRETPAFAPGAGGTVTNLYQTINTHDSLSESELTREAENLLERSRWKNP